MSERWKGRWVVVLVDTVLLEVADVSSTSKFYKWLGIKTEDYLNLRHSESEVDKEEEVSLTMKLSKLFVSAESFGKLTRPQLAGIRLKAIRRGVWFRVLNRLERAVMILTLKVTKKIRSKTLAKAVHSIVRKLLEALESKVRLTIKHVGVPLAKKLSLIAQKWGNTSARNWTSEKSFMKFLAIMHMNDPEVFKP